MNNKETHPVTAEGGPSGAGNSSSITIPSVPPLVWEEAPAVEHPVPRVLSPPYLRAPVFNDIRICQLLKERCYLTENQRVRIYLALSEDPPLGWSFIFMTYWQALVYASKPRVGIEDASLWVDCEPGRLKTAHLPELQKAMAHTNQTFGIGFQEQIEAELKKQRLDRETLEALDHLDLGLTPRIIPPPPSTFLRAYREPLTLLSFCALWGVVGLIGWRNLPVNPWSFLINPLLILIYAGVFFFVFRSAFVQMAHRFKVRQWSRRQRLKNLWPSQYSDRRGRE